VDVVKSVSSEARGLSVAAGEVGDFWATGKPAEKSSNTLALKTKGVVPISAVGEVEEEYVVVGEASGCWRIENHAVKSSSILALKTEEVVAISVGEEEGKLSVAVREVSR